SCMRQILLILFCGWCMAATAQRSPITGQVLQPDGSPLQGVTVQVKGTNTATVTDAQGRFSLSGPNARTLVFSYVGFSTQELDVSGNTPLRVVLEAQAGELDDVVVVAFGTRT